MPARILMTIPERESRLRIPSPLKITLDKTREKMEAMSRYGKRIFSEKENLGFISNYLERLSKYTSFL